MNVEGRINGQELESYRKNLLFFGCAFIKESLQIWHFSECLKYSGTFTSYTLVPGYLILLSTVAQLFAELCTIFPPQDQANL